MVENFPEAALVDGLFGSLHFELGLLLIDGVDNELRVGLAVDPVIALMPEEVLSGREHVLVFVLDGIDFYDFHVCDLFVGEGIEGLEVGTVLSFLLFLQRVFFSEGDFAFPGRHPLMDVYALIGDDVFVEGVIMPGLQVGQG